jgi:hypothetical protein
LSFNVRIIHFLFGVKVLLVQREFKVKDTSMEEFRALLRSYVDVTQGFNGCLK